MRSREPGGFPPGESSGPRRLRRSILLVLFTVVTGCADGGFLPPTGEDIARVAVTPEVVAVFVGDTVRFSASIFRLDGLPVPEPPLTWATSDPGIATIDPTGKFTAVAPGTLVVTATSGGVKGIAEAQVNPVGRADDLIPGTPLFPHQEEPHLIVDEAGVIHVGWKEMTEPGAAERVAYANSVDGGVTWTEAQLLEPMGSGWLQSDPWLALDGLGSIYFARLEVSLSTNETRIVVSRSWDRGATWGPPVAVADSTELDKEVLCGDGTGGLYAAYKQGPTLRLSRSEDGGRTWSASFVLPSSTDGPTGPVLAVSADGSVLAAWWSRPDDNLWVAASHDHGAAWGSARRVNPVAGSVPFIDGSRPAFPAVALGAGGSASVAWQDFGGGDWDVLLTRSEDGGTTWSDPLRINDSGLGHQFMPALASGPDGILHAAWYDTRTGNVNLVYARSTDGGKSWSTNIRVTSEETPVFHRRLGDYLGLAAGPDGEAFMVWTDRRSGEQNIYFARTSGF